MITYPDIKQEDTEAGQETKRPRINYRSFLTRVLTIIGLVVAVWLVWYAIDVALLAFAGILLAIFLRGMSDWLATHAPLTGKWALSIVLLALTMLIVGFGMYAAPHVANQADQIVERVPEGLQQLTGYLEQYQWGQALLARMPSAGEMASGQGNILARVTGVFSATFGMLANIFIILFVGLFIAYEPNMYVNGFLKLIPRQKRDRGREVLEKTGHALRWWIIARIFSMVLISVMTMIALWVLGVPLAFTLGLLTGLITFIPNIGSILAVVPPALLALTQSPMTALYVVIFYLFIQTIESNILTPWLQERAVSLPAAMVLLAQLFMGVVAGILGVAFAAPLLAVVMILVNELYIEDVLGEESSLMEEN